MNEKEIYTPDVKALISKILEVERHIQTCRKKIKKDFGTYFANYENLDPVLWGGAARIKLSKNYKDIIINNVTTIYFATKVYSKIG